jgi:hypothetical protein
MISWYYRYNWCLGIPQLLMKTSHRFEGDGLLEYFYVPTGLLIFVFTDYTSSDVLTTFIDFYSDQNAVGIVSVPFTIV